MKVQLSEHFWSDEFKCKCQRWNCDAKQLPDPTLVKVLERLREEISGPITIASGLRCPYWNERAGGKSESAHMEGLAVDIVAVTSQDRYKLMKFIPTHFTRFGIGSTFIHVDTSLTLAQYVCWTY